MIEKDEPDEADAWLTAEEQRLEIWSKERGVMDGFSVYVRKEWQTLFGPHWEGYEASPLKYPRGVNRHEVRVPMRATIRTSGLV